MGHKIKRDKRLAGALFLIAIFVLSLFGFALSMSSGKNTKNNYIQTRVLNGKTVYYISTPGGYFFFLKNYENSPSEVAKSIADKIEKYDVLRISMVGNYNDSLYVLQRALDYKGIRHLLGNFSCEEGTLILTEKPMNGSCIIINGTPQQVYETVDAVTYYLVK